MPCTDPTLGSSDEKNETKFHLMSQPGEDGYVSDSSLFPPSTLLSHVHQPSGYPLRRLNPSFLLQLRNIRYCLAFSLPPPNYYFLIVSSLLSLCFQHYASTFSQSITYLQLLLQPIKILKPLYLTFALFSKGSKMSKPSQFCTR